MKTEDIKICKVDDDRIKDYVNRTRSGSQQIFYKGNDSRDFDRYRAEGGNSGSGAKMHDKPDTIRIDAPEKHYYAELIDGEWWWVNGCAECNGRKRDWMTYIECEKHNVCRTCQSKRSEVDKAWGGPDGWQCGECHDIEADRLRTEALLKVANNPYNKYDYRYTDNIVCPHCASSYECDDVPPEGDEVCEVCGGEYTVEPNYEVTFSTECKGERITI